jgi:hypothetical protein
MMVHPAPDESLTLPCLAVEHLTVQYRGREAHASGYPELGINAADALTVAQVGIGLLRQHLLPSHRVHGIVTHGGDAPNIVPGSTSGAWYVRASTLAELEELSPRVRACFEAGALATGCDVEVELAGPRYSEFLPDALLLDAYAQRGDVRSVGSSAVTPPSCCPARPTWRTSRSACRRSTRCSGSRRTAPSTISPASPRRPSAPQPTAPSSTVRSRWRAPRSPSRSMTTRRDALLTAARA